MPPPYHPLDKHLTESQNVRGWQGPQWVTHSNPPLRTAALQQLSPSLSWCLGLFLPRGRTLPLPLVNLIRFLSAQLSSLSRSRWMAAQPAGVSTTPPSLVSSANWLRVTSNSSSRSLMKKLNQTGPSTDPWGHH